MISKLHIGKSTQEDLGAAVAEATGAAMKDALHPALAVVLATDGYPGEVLAGARSRQLGNLPWVGCSAAGVFADAAFLRAGLVVGVVSSPQAFVGVGAAGPVSGNPRSAGAAAVARALDQLPARSATRGRMALLFMNALGGHGAEVVRGAVHEGGTALAWAGGGAGDNLRFIQAAQFARGQAFSDHAVAAALDLPGHTGAGMRHGWRPYGPPTMVTRARGSHVLELEYEQAFEVYRRSATERGDEVTREGFTAFAMRHPLGIPQADGDHLIRDPIGVEADGSLRCVAEVPDGSLVRVMESNGSDLVGAARAAAEAARAAVGGPLGGAFVFDCVSRFLLLGDQGLRDELNAVSEGLGQGVPWMGCLTMGEVGALGAAVPQFHNKTTAVLALPG
ncbi:MAG: FIST C-terminal domain-containing protein [Deltaproteobacteria bacterium]|nr:FIST C-terminal domain-containing protein [Deltaproteobacteria bacterium]